MQGISPRAKARIAGTYLTDEAKIERYAGRSEEKPLWEDLGTHNCKLLDRASTTSGGDSVAHVSDAQVVVLAGLVSTDRNERYRITVRQNKSPGEKADPDGPPETKRTRVLESSQVDAYPDVAGGDLFQVLRCRNGRQ